MLVVFYCIPRVLTISSSFFVLLRPFAQDIVTRCENMLGIKSESRWSNKRNDDEDLKNFKFPEQTFDRSEIDRALDRGYANR